MAISRDELENLYKQGLGGRDPEINSGSITPLNTSPTTDTLTEPLYVDDILAARRDTLREPLCSLGRTWRHLREDFIPFGAPDRAPALATVGI